MITGERTHSERILFEEVLKRSTEEVNSWSAEKQKAISESIKISKQPNYTKRD